MRMHSTLPLATALPLLATLMAPPADATQGPLVAFGHPNAVAGLPGGDDFVDVSSSWGNNVALRADGTLEAWGTDFGGVVTATPGSGTFTKVETEWVRALALRTDGGLTSWGADQFGVVSNTPTETGFVDIDCANVLSAAMRADGSFVVWGHELAGSVSQAPTGSGYLDVALGEYWGVALRADGSLETWGLPTVNGNPVGTAPAGNDFVAVSANEIAGVALRQDGSLAAWGGNFYGILNGVPTGTGFTAVDLAFYTAVAQRADGTLVSWGDDTNCILSDYLNHGTVAQTPGFAFKDVAAGDGLTIGVKACGTIASTGAGCPGEGGFVPTLTGSGCATGGSTVTLEVANGRGGAMALFLAGTTTASIDASGCTLLTTAVVFHPFVLTGAGAGNGAATLTSSFRAVTPNLSARAQVAIQDPASPPGFTLTNGVVVTVD